MHERRGNFLAAAVVGVGLALSTDSQANAQQAGRSSSQERWPLTIEEVVIGSFLFGGVVGLIYYINNKEYS